MDVGVGILQVEVAEMVYKDAREEISLSPTYYDTY